MRLAAQETVTARATPSAPNTGARTTIAGTRIIHDAASAMVPSVGYPAPRTPSASRRRALTQKAPISRMRAIGTASEKAAPKNSEIKLGTAISRTVTAPSAKPAPSAK